MFVKFHHDTPYNKGIIKELEAKNHFLTIDKCHNSVRNYQNLPINNPKRDILDTNAYAKFE